MNDHYYSQKPNVESDRRTWTYELKGHNFTFQSDRGVFSKKEIDFGSQLLIESFVMPEVFGDVLDVGCGYGPIGLTIAKDSERQIEMIDINERAIELAKSNATLNQISNVIIYQSDQFTNVKSNKFAAILTNPPIRAGKKVVHEGFEESYNRLIDYGELWVVIQKKQGAPSAIEKMSEFFQEVEVVSKKKGYYIIKAKKY